MKPVGGRINEEKTNTRTGSAPYDFCCGGRGRCNAYDLKVYTHYGSDGYRGILWHNE